MLPLLRTFAWAWRHRGFYQSPERLEALRVGFLMHELVAAKERGWDWTLYSSWCSDQATVILSMRRPDGAPFPIARPSLREALEAAVRVVEGGR